MTTRNTILTLGLTGLCALGLGGCRGERTDAPPRQFFPDMDDSPKKKPQTESAFFADSRAMRPRVEGTVAYGVFASPGDAKSASALVASAAAARVDLLREDTGFYTGMSGKDAYMPVMPASLKVDAAMLERGSAKFNIYCAACHGYSGEGGGVGADGKPYGGMVGRMWSYAVPSFHEPRFSDPKENVSKDGYLFSVIQHGLPGAPDGGLKMPAYGDKISPADSWAVVAWIRVLQESRRGTLNDLPADERAATEAAMKAAREAAAAAAAAPAATPAPAPASTPAPGGTPR